MTRTRIKIEVRRVRVSLLFSSLVAASLVLLVPCCSSKRHTRADAGDLRRSPSVRTSGGSRQKKGSRGHPCRGVVTVEYEGSTSDRISALYRRPSGRIGPVILLGHGHGDSGLGMMRMAAEAFPGGEAGLLAPDHPFHGNRLKQKEEICPADPQELVARFNRAVEDLDRAVRAIGSLPGADPRRIGYMGYSLGGVLGGLLVARQPLVKAAVLLAPAGDWAFLAGSESRWKLGWRKGLLDRWMEVPSLCRRLSSVDPIYSIRKASPRPLLIVAGRTDRIITFKVSERLYRAAGVGSELLVHEGGHTIPLPVLRKAGSWLLERLSSKPSMSLPPSSRQHRP